MGRKKKDGRRIVAIGDLNASSSTLRAILVGLDVIDGRDRWIGGATDLVQVGDIFNRGPDARGAFTLLMKLRERAAAKKGSVTVLLGNHEVMTALGHEGYCTAAEYLAFATAKQRDAWPGRVKRASRRLARENQADGLILPVGPRLEAWKVENVPGRSAMRRALGPRGKLGRQIRKLPVATVIDGYLFCHSAPAPKWVRDGVEGLNEAAAEAWADAPPFFPMLPRDGVFLDRDGPLWNRDLVRRDGAARRRRLETVLRRTEATRLVVGHTQTRNVPGGEVGHIALRHDGALVCIDVGLGLSRHIAALVIQGGRGIEWRPDGTRTLWKRDRRPSTE